MRSVNARIAALCWLPLLPTVGAAADTGPQRISDVSLDVQSFNTALDEHVRLAYTLARPDEVTVRVYDADGGLVRTVLDGDSQDAGEQEVRWDGRDVEGYPVPDEAYTFTIETASGVVHDPTTFSGGVVSNITEARISDDGIVTYELPRPSRVLIRLGIHGGPMHKTLVDWKPRVGGNVSEYWDGYDEHDLMKLRELENFTVLITSVTLPDTSVITYGNGRETYREYKLGRAADRPRKPRRTRAPDPDARPRPTHLVPPAWARAPRISMEFPSLRDTGGESIPEVGDLVDVRIDVDPADRDQLVEDQFEVMFFVDNVYFAEAERGYLPINWRWELHQVPAGEHVLTANVTSFRGQVGVASRKLSVVRAE